MTFLPKFLAILTVAFVIGVSPNAFAAQCDTNSPMNSAIYTAFRVQYDQDYNRSQVSGAYDQSVVLGHALGRLAIAVQSEPDREVGYACVMLWVEQAIAANELQGLAALDYRVIQEAAMGMHDAKVEQLTGVRDRSAYNNVMEQVYGRSMRIATLGNSRGSAKKLSSQPSGSNKTTPQSIFGITSNSSSSASGNTYANRECTSYANFSLRNADTYLGYADNLQNIFVQKGFENCYGDAWYICRDIMANLTEAQTQVNQVFMDAISGNCRKCNLDAVQRYGHELLSREELLVKRGYNSAWGFAQTFSRAIDDHMNDKKCDLANQPNSAPRTVSQNSSPVASSNSGQGGKAPQFIGTANAGIPGYNQEVHHKVSLSQCQSICIQRSWCKSVDYERVAKRCYVQPVGQNEKNLKTNYTGNPYDHYTLSDR